MHEKTNYFNKPLHPSMTLIEIIMVITIVGIIAALAIPRFEPFFAIKLDGAVKKVAQDIRYTQQLAISRHENCVITFNTGTNSYNVLCNGVAATDPFTHNALAMNFNTDSQYGGIDITSASFTGGALTFNWQGNASEAGSVGMNYKNNSRTISVTTNTGLVSVQ